MWTEVIILLKNMDPPLTACGEAGSQPMGIEPLLSPLFLMSLSWALLF